MSLSFKKKSGFAGLLGIISAIVLLALAFHYPVRIIDALSSEQVSDFDINKLEIHDSYRDLEIKDLDDSFV